MHQPIVICWLYLWFKQIVKYGSWDNWKFEHWSDFFYYRSIVIYLIMVLQTHFNKEHLSFRSLLEYLHMQWCSIYDLLQNNIENNRFNKMEPELVIVDQLNNSTGWWVHWVSSCHTLYFSIYLKFSIIKNLLKRKDQTKEVR